MKTLQIKNIPFFSLLLALSLGFSSSILAQSSPKIAAVDAYVNTVLQRSNIPGAAVAVIQNGEVIHENYYGKASLEYNIPVTEKSIFRLYSLTKLMVSNSIFKLIEDGKLSLDDKAAKYLTDLPKTWKSVKIEHLLSHSSGLPEFDVDDNLNDEEANAKVYTFPIQFEAGDHFDYNQTNYWLLTRIINKVTGTSMEEYVFAQQFPEESKEIMFSSNSLSIIPNRVTRYSVWNPRREFQADFPYNSKRAHSGNGLNISLREFIKWSQRFDQNAYMTPESRAKMWSPFSYKNQGKMGHGWGIYPIANQSSYGFTGGVATGMRKFKDGNLTIIWLTNGWENRYSIDGTIDYIAGIVDVDLKDDTNLAAEFLTTEITQEGAVFSNSLAAYKKAKKEYPNANFEGILNTNGYALLNQRKQEQP